MQKALELGVGMRAVLGGLPEEDLNATPAPELSHETGFSCFDVMSVITAPDSPT